jgi:AraC-like DNA-binding protein
MKSPRPTNPALPLVRLNLVEPLLRLIDQRGISIGDILEQFSLKRSEVSNSEVFVPAPKMYEIVESLADLSGDPYFGIHAGESLDPWSWSPLSDIAHISATLGEFLLRFMESAQQDASSVIFSLNTQNGRSTFREGRVTDGGIFPRHNDGFTIAYLLAIVRRAVGSEWDGARVLARCCEPEVIPSHYLGIRTAGTDTLGASISFPASWLLEPLAFEQSATMPASPPLESSPSGGFIEDFRRLIRPYLKNSDLDMDRVAVICGLSKRTLSRRLQIQGTTAHREILALRREKAENKLRNTTLAIGAIAAGVGYSNPAVFSRAFKRWTGMSPRAFRKADKALSGKHRGGVQS